MSTWLRRRFKVVCVLGIYFFSLCGFALDINCPDVLEFLTQHYPKDPAQYRTQDRIGYWDSNLNQNIPVPSVSDLIQNHTISDLNSYLASSAITKEAWPFYDKTTGVFNYKPIQKHRLALENGDAPLKALHINWWKRNSISEAELNDLHKVLDKIPGLELWIEVEPQEKAGLENFLTRFSKKIRGRIKVIAQDGPNKTARGPLIWAQDSSKPLADSNSTLLPPSLFRGSE